MEPPFRWTSRATPPPHDVHCLACDPQGRLFVGTRRGLFVSEDGASSWRPAGLDGVVNVLEFLGNDLWAGTMDGLFRSADGKSAKAAIAWNPSTREIRAGQFDVASGFEHWILKFDGVGKDSELGSSSYGRIEFAYSRMAARAGIRMSDCRLLEENGRAHFMTRRFDREGNRKHHLQTLSALAHLDYKQKATHDYNQYLELIGELVPGPEALEEAFRRIAFNVMARNCDDDTKNLSFLLPQGGSWQLAPAYDLSHAYHPSGEWTYQHLMSVNGKFKDITRKDLLVVADRFGIGTAPKVLRGARDAVGAWPEFAKAAELGAREWSRIKANQLLL